MIGDLFSVPVIESAYVPEGQGYVLNGMMDGFWVGRDLYHEPASSVRGYVQRRANALRRDLGLEEVDYAAEREAERARRLYTYAAAHALGFGFREYGSVLT